MNAIVQQNPAAALTSVLGTAPDTSAWTKEDWEMWCAMMATPLRQTPRIDRLATALAEAMKTLHSPKRNRNVKIKPKFDREANRQPPEYEFRYTTLDELTDYVRPILAAQGLILLQPIVTINRHPHVLTRLQHASGQYLEQEVMVPGEIGRDLKHWGGNVTYVRRYCAGPMLGLASDDDDDASAATGDTATDQRGRQERLTEEAKRAANTRDPESVRRAAFAKAKGARDVKQGIDLLTFWTQNRTTLFGFEGNEDTWRGLIRETYQGLARALGKGPANIFVAAARAKDKEVAETFDARWEGEWADMLATIKAEAPPLLEALLLYAKPLIDAARQMPKVEDKPTGDAASSTGPVEQGGAQPLLEKDREDGPAFRADLFDAEGMPVGSYENPVAFAKGYASLHREVVHLDYPKLAKFNARGIVAAVKYEEARSIIDRLSGRDTTKGATGGRARATAGADQWSDPSQQ